MHRHSFLCLIIIFSFSFLYSQSIVPEIQWYKIYNGSVGEINLPNAYGMDAMNNIYLAGRGTGTDGTADAAVLKYSEDGELLAEIRYSSGSASWDEAYSIAVDSDLNIWITGDASFGGSSPYTILQKYSPSGELLFAKYFNDDMNINSEGGKVITDSRNDVVLGYYLSYAKIAKYSSAGDSLWTISVYDTSSYTVEYLLADNQDNVYAALTKSYWDGGDYQITKTAVIKISNSGEVLWKKEYDCQSPLKIIFDKDENILLISAEDAQLIKIDKDGDVLWTDNNSSAQQSLVIITDVAADTENNVIITGYGATGDNWDYVTRKLSPYGNEIWLKMFDSELNLNDFASSLVTDKDNNIYITGGTYGTISGGNCYTVKYSQNGDLMWVQEWDAPNSEFETASGIFVDDSSNIFIAGDAADSANGYNIFLLKIKQVTSTGINENVNVLPLTYTLNQNYPNPFNPTTTIRYTVPSESFVSIKIYDVLGNEIQTLVNEEKQAGSYEVEFNGSNLASGMYICEMKAGGYTNSCKMLALK
jgi:hypothetical protein